MPDADSPCFEGACCLDEDTCEDELPGGQPMTEPDCDVEEGTFIGGAECICFPDPCSPCRIDTAFCPPGDLSCADCNKNGVADGCDLEFCDGDPGCDDCNENGILDECDIESKTSEDINGNGVPDECDPRACCFKSSGFTVCQEWTPKECEAIGGVVQPVWLNCSQRYVITARHTSGAFTQVTNRAEECPNGVGPGTRQAGECEPGEPIDAWESTQEDAEMCHQFGVTGSPAIPADFFGTGSNAFDGEICLIGEPLEELPPRLAHLDFGTADTLIERSGDPFGPCEGPSRAQSTVNADVIALSLRSVAPITVTYSSGPDENWNVAVDLSEVPPEDQGTVTARKDDPNGGIYWSSLYVLPRFTFTEVTGNRDPVVLDFGDAEDCPDCEAINLVQEESAEAPWAVHIAGTPRPPSPICTSFYPGVEDPDSHDCDGDGTEDACELALGDSVNCQRNGIPDDCDIANGTSVDVAPHDGVPDECVPPPPLCVPPPAPELDTRVPDLGFGSRNRYLSFGTGSTGLTEAMRLTFVSLPPPHDAYNGDQWFVGQPFEVTEASGSNLPVPPPTFWAATLQCGSPHYDDWSQYGVVHVYDAGIVPGGQYLVQAISDAIGCDPANEAHYSTAVTINTSAIGDLVGNNGCPSVPCDPPQGVIDFVDISSCVEKFKNSPLSPQKARADVINSTVTSPLPDRKVDFVDISTIVEAFRGSALPLPGPQQHRP